MMGQSFARWTLGGASSSNVIGHVDGVLVAEAAAHGTPLVDKSVRETGLRERTGVAVVGVWRRGRFQPARPETKIDDNTVLVLAGGKEHLARYDEAYQRFSRRDTPVVILGGGRVGRATALGLAQAGLDYRIVEKVPEQAETDSKRWVVGDAAEIEVLQAAGMETTQTVVVTTQKDDVNVYLTIYCRKLRPDIQILARATHERNVATLHRAGADFVLSYASMGATTLFNLMKRSSVLMVAEGLDVFRVRVPESLAGMTIAESGIRERTGCSVVAVGKSGAMQPVPNPGEKLAADKDLLLIGSVEAEERFLDVFPDCVAAR